MNIISIEITVALCGELWYVLWLQREGYHVRLMKALQERFDKKPPERLVRAVQSAREEVREGEWMMRSARSCSVC